MRPMMHLNIEGAFTLSEVEGLPLDSLCSLGVNGTTHLFICSGSI